MGTLVTAEKHEDCGPAAISVSELLSRIGGKWTIFVMMELSEGPRRFSDLRRGIEGVSQKVLTTTLRDLERDGFVTRMVTPIIPPRVDYKLTALGRDLLGPVAALSAWAVSNRARVEGARERYDSAEAAR
jgi:DNA-binding HxlR family transcriptional regulator